MPAVLGYGSLILPESLIGRFADVGPLSSVYGEHLGQDSSQPVATTADGLCRVPAVEAWESTYSDRIDYHPVRVDGLRRSYALTSSRGGLMLVVRPDDDAWCNAVVVTGLTADEADAVTASESGYDVVERSTAAMEPYASDLPETTVSVYATSERPDPPAGLDPNPTYHARIERGIDRLAESHGEPVADRFREEFHRTTHVPTSDGWTMLVAG
jgi:hypothetical protein